MGKKSAGEATNLFKGLEDVKVKPSKKDELGVSMERTATKITPVAKEEKSSVSKSPPGLSSKGKSQRSKGFEDIDPILEKMLVHPEPTSVSKVVTPEDMASLDESTPIPVRAPTPTRVPTPARSERSKLNVVKAEKNVVAPIIEDKKPVSATSPAQSRVEAFDDKTQKIPSIKAVEVPDQFSAKSSPSISDASMGLEEQLRSANYLELAQNRVLELEKEVQKLRRDNEQLSSAGQHFKELTESIKQQLRQSEANFSNLKEIAEEEKKILTQSLEAKEIKIGALQERLIELEEKINSSFDHVRIRERELENRLEIMKTESDAVMSSKDEMILDLKKQLNLVNSDLEKYRIQNQKITTKMEGKEELLRRTVKALRIALTMLEGSRPDDDN